MYREDFQNILRKQRPSLFTLGGFIQPRTRTKDRYKAKFGDIFQESLKQKIQSPQQYASNSRNKLNQASVGISGLAIGGTLY